MPGNHDVVTGRGIDDCGHGPAALVVVETDPPLILTHVPLARVPSGRPPIRRAGG